MGDGVSILYRSPDRWEIAIVTVPGTVRVVGRGDFFPVDQFVAALVSHFDYVPCPATATALKGIGCRPFEVEAEFAVGGSGDTNGAFAEAVSDAQWQHLSRRPAVPARELAGVAPDSLRQGHGFFRVQEFIGAPHSDKRSAAGAALYVTQRGSWLCVPGGGGAWQGQIVPADTEQAAAVADLMACAMARVWRMHGWFVLHCAAVVAPTGRGLIFPAFSGHGKSSTMLALIRHGNCRLVGDDKLLLRCTGAPPTQRVIGFPMQRFVNLATDVADYYPDLAFLRDCTDSPTWPKVRIDMHAANLGAQPAPMLDVSFAGFVRIQPNATTTQRRPISRQAAVEALMQQSVISLEPAHTAAQLSTLVALAAQAECVALELGADVYHDPAAVARLLEVTP